MSQNTKDASEHSHQIRHTATILREIVTIIMGIAFTQAIIIFLVDGLGKPVPFKEFALAHVFSFVCVITTVVRFFHGNARYLMTTYKAPDAVAEPRHDQLKLAIDFLFIFLQGVLFCALGQYQKSTRDFYVWFTLLFYVDSAWFFFGFCFSGQVHQSCDASVKLKEQRTTVYWMVANLVTGILMTCILLTNETLSTGWMIVLVIVIQTNAVLDYWLNRQLYFPSGVIRAERASAFAGARLTSAANDDTFDDELREKIETVHKVVSEAGMHLYSAHREEEFGSKTVPPEEFVHRDICQLAAADVFIGLVDEQMSGGLHIELGWASYLQKPIILLVPETTGLSATTPMVNGLGELTRCRIVQYNADTLESVLRSALSEFVKGVTTGSDRARL